MRYGSDAFYSTVATLLPIFAFISLYQRQRGFFLGELFPKGMKMPRRLQLLATFYRSIQVLLGSVWLTLTFVTLMGGEVLCLLSLGGQTDAAWTYHLVWVCMVAQFCALTLAELGNLSDLRSGPLIRELARVTKLRAEQEQGQPPDAEQPPGTMA